MKCVIFLVFFSAICSSNTWGRERFHHKLEVGVISSLINVETKASDSTESASTTFNSISIQPEYSYFITSKSAAHITYSKSVSGTYLASGASLGYRQYFLQGTTVVLEKEGQKIEITPDWSPFATLSYKFLSISANNSEIRFEGAEIDVGVDYHLRDFIYVNLKLSYAQLASGTTRNSTPLGFYVGVGKSF